VVLLFDCYVCRQNVTCLIRFTRYGHYTDEVEDNDNQIRHCFLNRYAKIRAFTKLYDIVYLTCSKKLTCSHHTGRTEKLKKKRTKNKSRTVISNCGLITLR